MINRVLLVGVFILVWGGSLFGASLPQNWAFSQANDALANGNSIEAVTTYQDLESDGVQAGELYNNLGQAYYVEGNLEKALDAFKEASLTLEGQKQAEAFYNWGNAAFQSGNLDDARTFYQNALSLNPQDVDAKHNLELVIRQLQQQQQQQNNSNDNSDNQDNQEDVQQARQQLQEEQEKEKEQAENILNAIEQKERDARDEEMGPAQGHDISVEYDW